MELNFHQMADLQLRTGVCGVAFFSWGNADDPTLPHIVNSADAMDFLTEALQISSLDLLRNFERWICTREGGVFITHAFTHPPINLSS